MPSSGRGEPASMTVKGLGEYLRGLLFRVTAYCSLQVRGLLHKDGWIKDLVDTRMRGWCE